MGIRFYCPNGHKLNVKEFQAGQKGICPVCGAKMQIPLEKHPPKLPRATSQRSDGGDAGRRRSGSSAGPSPAIVPGGAVVGPAGGPGNETGPSCRAPAGAEPRPIRWPRRGRGTFARPPADNLARPPPRSCASGWPKGASPPTRSSGATAGATGRRRTAYFRQLSLTSSG